MVYSKEAIITDHCGGSTNKSYCLLGPGLDRNLHNKINNNLSNSILTLNPNEINNSAAIDSGALAHFFIPNLLEGTTEIKYNPITVTLPNGTNISSIKTIILPESKQLPTQVRIASIFEQLIQEALILIE